MSGLGTPNSPPKRCENSYNAVIRKISGECHMQQPSWFRAALLFGLLIAVLILAFGILGHARAQGAAQTDKPYVVEYYYKTKWGHADEFIALFKKNHYPLLKKQVEMGRFLNVSAVAPVYHTTEDGRWDYRVTIVYKNAAVAGHLQKRRAAALRDSRCPLGFAD
jgi:hypothetical protein